MAKAHALTPRDFGRAGRVIRHVEREALAAGAGDAPAPPVSPISFAVVTSLVTAGSTTPGAAEYYRGQPCSEEATSATSTDVFSQTCDLTSGTRVLLLRTGYGTYAMPVDPGSGRFECTTGLTAGGSVVGNLMTPAATSGWTATTHTATFYDDYYGTITGSSGLRGEYRYNPVSGRREIMALECT